MIPYTITQITNLLFQSASLIWIPVTFLYIYIIIRISLRRPVTWFIYGLSAFLESLFSILAFSYLGILIILVLVVPILLSAAFRFRRLRKQKRKIT